MAKKKTIVKQRQIMIENNISLEECQNIISAKKRNLWEREIDQEDFLDLRVGVGSSELVGKISVPEEHFSLNDDDLLISYYETMKELQEEIQSLNLSYAPCTELSMGMTSDYKLAIEHGATMVRLGTIFKK